MSRQVNRRPRKSFMASRDLGKKNEGCKTTGGTIVYSSGPYDRKRFRTQKKAQAWLDKWDGEPEWGTIYELRWTATD